MVVLLFVRSVLAVPAAPSQILAAGDSTSNLDDEARTLVTLSRTVASARGRGGVGERDAARRRSRRHHLRHGRRIRRRRCSSRTVSSTAPTCTTAGSCSCAASASSRPGPAARSAPDVGAAHRPARDDAAARASSKATRTCCCTRTTRRRGTTRCCRSRSRCASRARRTTRGRRCAPASPPSATWAPRGPATPTSGSSRRSTQGIIPGPADGRHDARHRRDRQLRADGLRPGVRRAAGGRGGRRRDARARRPRPDRPRRRLDQGLRRLPLGPERRGRPDVLARRAEADRRGRRRARRGRSSRTRCTTEGMRRAVLAGVETIEHGDGGTPRCSG